MFRLRLTNIKMVTMSLLCCLLSSCATTSPMVFYYRYSIGQLRIDNPVLVYHNGENYVCPDSAVYCCADKGWTARNDVFPYILTTAELLDSKKPIKFTSRAHRLRSYDNNYSPYNEAYGKEIQLGNEFFYVDKLKYGKNLFDAYMESSSGEYYDSSDPLGQNPGSDQFNAFRYKTKSYRIVLRAHFSISEIFKMRKDMPQLAR